MSNPGNFESVLGDLLDRAMSGDSSRLFPSGLTVVREGDYDYHRLPTYTCRACEDTGLVSVEVPRSERLYGANAGMMSLACRCLCEQGQTRNVGMPLSSVADHWSELQLLSYWPQGTPEITRRIGDRLAQVGFLPVMRNWTFESYRATVLAARKDLRPFVKYAEVWVGTPLMARADVVIFGPPGTGKTGLAVCAARACLEKGDAVRFTSARDLMNLWRSTMKNDGPSEAEVYAPFRDADVLVIDEIGGTSLTQFVQDSLLALLDHRQKSQRPTILTLNLPSGTLANETKQIMSEMFGPALYDRLVPGTFWYLDGKSTRGVKVAPAEPQP